MPTTIAGLYENILWKIFLMNTYRPHPPPYSVDALEVSYHEGIDVHKSSPLFNTIRTSQVCQSWRSILLQSPSIWGRLLDLDDMNSTSNARKYELLGRTGDAPLYIRGFLMAKDTQLFFFNILNTEWSRIKEIDIRTLHPCPHSAWSPFLRPNPTLRYLRLSDSFNFNTSIFRGTPAKLFSDSAPSLCVFLSPNLAVDLQAPWLAHLQMLELSDISVSFTALQALQLVKNMRYLTSISLDFGQVEPPSPGGSPNSIHPLPHISSSALQFIKVSGLVSACCGFLSHVSPAPACSLSFIPCFISPNDVDECHATFDRFLNNYLPSLPLTTVCTISGGREYFTYTLENARDDEGPSLDILFEFELLYPSQILVHVEELFLSSLARIRQVNVSIRSLHLIYMSWDFDTDRLLNFARTLSSLKTLLIAPMKRLDNFKDITCANGAPIFPALKALKVYARGDIHVPSLQNFLSHRQRNNVPLSHLDLTSCSIGTLRQVDLGWLETFRDLRVTWKGPSSLEFYICGSGSPQQLDFTTRYAY